MLKFWMLLAAACLKTTCIAAQSPRGEFHPAWSPDGTKVAFAADYDGDFEIYVVDVANGFVEQLTFNSVLDSTPWFLPSGDSVVYSSDVSIQRALYVSPTRPGMASPYVVLPATPLNRPIVTSNGDLMFNTGVGTDDRNVVVLSADSGEIDIVAGGPSNEEWGSLSSDGGLLLFSTDRVGHWEVFEKRGRQPARQVTYSPATAESDAPQLSPDATWFVYQSNKSGDFEVYRRELATGHERNLTQSPGSADAIPVVSPDGRWIAFESTRDQGARKIFVMRSDGTSPRALTPQR